MNKVRNGFALVAALVALACGAAAGTCKLAAHDARRAGPGCAQRWMDANLRLDDILTVGTHNSYKQAIAPTLMALIKAAAPKDWRSLDYHQPPLADQLDDGARALELDVAYDPSGGRFAHPAGLKRSGRRRARPMLAAMSAPGFKVLHIQDLDFASSCLTFVDCLRIVRAWSLAHPRHVPILITLNTER